MKPTTIDFRKLHTFKLVRLSNHFCPETRARTKRVESSSDQFFGKLTWLLWAIVACTSSPANADRVTVAGNVLGYAVGGPGNECGGTGTIYLGSAGAVCAMEACGATLNARNATGDPNAVVGGQAWSGITAANEAVCIFNFNEGPFGMPQHAAFRDFTCPAGYRGFGFMDVMPIYTTAYSDKPLCTTEAPTDDKDRPPGECVGNPISCGNGEKYQSETDIAAGTPQPAFARTYFSKGTVRDLGIGKQWTHSYAASITYTVGVSSTSISMQRPNGRIIQFIRDFPLERHHGG